MSYTHGKQTIALIQLVAEIKKTGRKPTVEELRLMDSWYGWGSVADAFAPKSDPGWKEIGAQITLHLGELCGARGVNEARKAIVTSYFTDNLLSQAIWKLVRGLGFTGGRVLEAGCGTGSFLATAPADLSLQRVGVERDPFSALVAQMRLPDAEIINDRLQKVAFARQSFDLAIGNVPFANINVVDDEEKVALSLHNYFLLRELRALRKGGILAAISSRHTLDAQETEQRLLLEKYGNFLGAFRLPSGAHKAAHTQVVTDILVFQRRDPAEKAASKSWLGLSTKVVEGLSLNQHFEEYPWHIVGRPESGRGMYGNDELIIKQPRGDFPGLLDQLVQEFLRDAACEQIAYVPRHDFSVIDEALVPRREDGYLEGSYYLRDGQVIQIVDGQIKKVERYRDALKALVILRDAALALFEAEQDLDRSDASLRPLRAALNRAYQAYVEKHGALLQSKLIHGKDEDGEQTLIRKLSGQISAFRSDKHFATLVGLVHWNDKKHREEKADIFFRRIHRKPEVRTSAADPSEALAICLDQVGRLDLDVIGRLLSVDPAAVPTLLGAMAYEDPQRGQWVATDEYISGNVRIKLAQARQAVEEHGPRFQRNVNILEPVVPSDLSPEDIHASLGVTWVPPTDIQQFCYDLTRIETTVGYESKTSTWGVAPKAGSNYGAAATSTWGTARVNAIRLVEAGLNRRTPYVWDEQYDGTRVKNQDESVAAQEKLAALQEKFSEWVWEEPERAHRLAARYNELFRSEIPRQHDGAFLTFPDMSAAWVSKMYPWQKNFIARMIASRSGLCGHPVGAGKTMTMIATAMTLRRLGSITRAGIVVPNHLLEQIASEAKRLYPQARILMISRADLTKEKKAIFAARIAAGDYDLAVLTHSSLYALGMHPETERAFLEEKVAVYRQALLDQLGGDETSLSKRTAKSLEKQIERLELRQEQLLKKSTTGVTFEHLGLDMLLIDEAHEYKNLGLPSNIEGFQVDPSRRAIDLEMKLRWLEKRGKGPFGAFFTATPLSNNMVEAYVVAWYLDQQRLLDYGLNSVDAFVANFIDISSEVEVSPDGSTFRMKSRPRSFFNIIDFLEMFAQFADIQSEEILDDKRPRREDITVAVDATPEMLDLVASLVKRADDLRSGKRTYHGGKQDNMLRIVHEGRELAVSPRQVGILTGPSPKVEAVADKMVEVFQRWQRHSVKLPGEFNSLQIGFCDLGTPNPEKGDQVYGELKRALIERGIPEHGIRYIHEANNDAAKAELFTQCRNGEVAILLGSTAKLGTGTNVQYRCAAIHLIAPPWRPSDVEQCIGRGHRPGNRFTGVQIYRYVVRKTFDAYMWQALERKSHFIHQLMCGKVTGREIDAKGEIEMNYAEVKAAATGDLLVLEQAKIDMEVARLQRLAKTFFSARERDKKESRTARLGAEAARRAAQGVQAFATKVQQCKYPGYRSPRGETLEDNQEIGKFLTQQIFDFLMRGARDWQQVGCWSDQNLYLAVSGDVNSLTVDVAVSNYYDEQLRITINPIWTGDGQQWRIAKAIDDFCGKTSARYERLLNDAATKEREAIQFEEQAQKAFSQAEVLTKQMGRKVALDRYTAAVAGNKSAAEIKALRVELLAGVDQESTLELEKSIAPAQPLVIMLVPEVEEPVQEEEVAMEENQAEETVAEQLALEVKTEVVAPVAQEQDRWVVVIDPRCYSIPEKTEEAAAVAPIQVVPASETRHLQLVPAAAQAEPTEQATAVKQPRKRTATIKQLQLVPTAAQAAPEEQVVKKPRKRTATVKQLQLVPAAEKAAPAGSKAQTPKKRTATKPAAKVKLTGTTGPVQKAFTMIERVVSPISVAAMTAVSLFGELLPEASGAGETTRKRAPRRKKAPAMGTQLCLPGLEVAAAPMTTLEESALQTVDQHAQQPEQPVAAATPTSGIILQFGKVPLGFATRRKKASAGAGGTTKTQGATRKKKEATTKMPQLVSTLPLFEVAG